MPEKPNPLDDRFLAELKKNLGSLAEFKNLWPTMIRISRETPNIVPLLNFIPPSWWPRRDLWQDKVLRAASPVFKNFSPAALRWLRRAPAETLASYYRYFERYKYNCPEKAQPEVAKAVAELMAALPPRATDQPELAEAVMFSSWVLYINIITNGPLLAMRLLPLQARHIVAIWDSSKNPLKKEKLEVVIDEVAEERYDILDWLIDEGLERGLPDKNSTWRSLKRRSDKWHDQFRWAERLELLRKEPEGRESTAWESLLGETVIDGLKVTPLVTGLDLYRESCEMRHCVVTYAPRCLNDGWRIFSLVEAYGTRSTLSLRPENNGYAIDQHKGPDNRPVSPAAARAAREVCRLYNQKHLEAAETDLTGAAA